MPGYAQYQKIAPQIAGAVKSGAVTPAWSADGKSFEYAFDGKRYRYDVAARQATPIGDAADAAGRGGRGGRGQGAPERGRQYASADSPDGTLRAQYNDKDRNLYLVDLATKAETAITTDGSAEKRIKYGTASWVYGEELDQITAMWWSPDSRKLAFYRFDESGVPDYYLQLDQTKLQSSVDTEAYPKAGAPNPVVDLLIYDVASKKTTKVDVRDGKPFNNDVVGHYAYHVNWSPDGKELLFNRTNRRQNVLEMVAAEPESGELRVVLREEWPTGWIENSPTMVFLKDSRRFIWQSERNGWSNFYLYDLERQADYAADHAHHVRGRCAGEGRRGGRRDVLHGARRRQSAQAATASRRPRWPRGRAPHRSEVPPHGRLLHGRRGRRPRARRRGELRDCRRQQAFRRRLPDPQHAAGDPRRRRRGRQDGGGGGGERLDEVRAARAEEGRDVHLQVRGRPDDAARADSVPVDVRSVAQVSGAGAGLRRAGVGEQHCAGDVRHAFSAHRVRLPRRQPRFARRAGPRQAHCSIRST